VSSRQLLVCFITTLAFQSYPYLPTSEVIGDPINPRQEEEKMLISLYFLSFLYQAVASHEEEGEPREGAGDGEGRGRGRGRGGRRGSGGRGGGFTRRFYRGGRGRGGARSNGSGEQEGHSGGEEEKKDTEPANGDA